MASSSPILSAPVSGSPSSGSLPTQQEMQELLGTSPVPFASTGVSLPFGLQTPQQAGLLESNAAPAPASASAVAMSGLQEGEVNTSSPQPSEIQQLRQEMATMQGEFRHNLRAMMSMLDGSSGATLHLTGTTQPTPETGLNVPVLATTVVCTTQPTPEIGLNVPVLATTVVSSADNSSSLGAATGPTLASLPPVPSPPGFPWQHHRSLYGLPRLHLLWQLPCTVPRVFRILKSFLGRNAK